MRSGKQALQESAHDDPCSWRLQLSISVLYELLYLCFVNVRELRRRQNSQDKYKEKNDLSSRNPVMSAPRLIFFPELR